MLARAAYQRTSPEAIRAPGTLRVAIWINTAVSGEGSTVMPERAATVSPSFWMRSSSALWRATASSGLSFGPSAFRRSQSDLMVDQASATLKRLPTWLSPASTSSM